MLKPEDRKAMLETARRLFNTQGYDRVSMRQLADELHMAVGNLTYYFPRKRQIVEALMQDSFEQARADGPVETLEQINVMFSRMLDTLAHNSFYFLDLEFAAEARQNAHHDYLRAQLLAGLEHLVEKGLFQPSFDAETRKTVLGMLLMTHMTWLWLHVRAASMDEEALRGARERLLRGHWTILRPYLTPAGLDALERMKVR